MLIKEKRNGIVKEIPVYVYYAYLKSIWDYRFNSLIVFILYNCIKKLEY